jgi:mRNA interferase RelE/StbE
VSYELEFKKPALKEWKKLEATVQTQFKKKLLDVLANPHIPGSKLSEANQLNSLVCSGQLQPNMTANSI